MQPFAPLAENYSRRPLPEQRPADITPVRFRLSTLFLLVVASGLLFSVLTRIGATALIAVPLGLVAFPAGAIFGRVPGARQLAAALGVMLLCGFGRNANDPFLLVSGLGALIGVLFSGFVRREPFANGFDELKPNDRRPRSVSRPNNSCAKRF